jgi:hypothetical protein
MLATLVGLSLLLALVGGTATLAGCLLARRLRARQAQRHPEQAAVRGSGPARLAAWQPSGRCSLRRLGWVTGISGPASTASRWLSSSLTTKA